jgi:hypothetical protein
MSGLAEVVVGGEISTQKGNEAALVAKPLLNGHKGNGRDNDRSNK